MEIQVADEPEASSPYGPISRVERKLTVECRTLSIQISRQLPHQSRQQSRISRHSGTGWWDRLCHVLPLRKAYDQHQVDHADQEAQLEATADELSSLKFHLDSVDEILTKFGTSRIQGLEDEAIKRRRERDGPNVLSSSPSRIFLKIFDWLFSGFCPLLWVAAVFVWISWKPLGNPANPQYLALGVTIFLVIALQASFSAWQEWTTSRIMASITSMLPTESIVTRNGTMSKIMAADLVQGDVVHVRGGDKIPADLRLIEA
ncbi:hypothetical protein H4S03_007795, partial [Coemansia sp. S3946]